MVKPKGGRGYFAPYQTTHLRIPTGAKTYLEEVIDCYRDKVLSGEVNPDVDWKPNSSSNSNCIPSLDEVLLLARGILKQKKSARQSIIKLLTALYKVDIDSELL
jgi:hypothetical protein